MKRAIPLGMMIVTGPCALLVACERDLADRPPDIAYDASVCAECGMILSDERFATATIVKDERGGRIPLLFDDFNCQVIHESGNTALVIVARWVHDHGSRSWVEAEQAIFVRSDGLRTPMDSGVAAFATAESADEMIREIGGEVVSFADLFEGGG